VFTLTALVCGSPVYGKDKPKAEVDGCGLYVCLRAEVPGSSGGSRPNGNDGGGSADRAGNSGGSRGRDGGDGASVWQCTYELADPQPPAGSADWQGHQPGDGAVYEERCIFNDGGDVTVGRTGFTRVRVVWAPEQPEAPQVDPAVLAQEAVEKMLLRGPEIGITPKPGGTGVVGMPVYLWTEKSPETYGPNTASASAGGMTVTATAKVTKIVWEMGDGNTVTCTTAGTPYKAEYGKRPSPDCGHRYSVPSSTTSSGKFHVTATSTWAIDWRVVGGGPSGELTEVRDSSVDITVAEVQVLN
jgi:hypothetical protein